MQSQLLGVVWLRDSAMKLWRFRMGDILNQLLEAVLCLEVWPDQYLLCSPWRSNAAFCVCFTDKGQWITFEFGGLFL